MNKFLLRNLKNERRMLERKLDKVNSEIKRIEDTEEIFTGKLTLGNVTNIIQSNVEFESDKARLEIKFRIKFERYDKEVVCTLITDDHKFDEPMKFVGTAKCSEEDTFDLVTGMTIAQYRAIVEVYKYIIGVFI